MSNYYSLEDEREDIVAKIQRHEEDIKGLEYRLRQIDKEAKAKYGRARAGSSSRSTKPVSFHAPMTPDDIEVRPEKEGRVYDGRFAILRDRNGPQFCYGGKLVDDFTYDMVAASGFKKVDKTLSVILDTRPVEFLAIATRACFFDADHEICAYIKIACKDGNGSSQVNCRKFSSFVKDMQVQEIDNGKEIVLSWKAKLG